MKYLSLFVSLLTISQLFGQESSKKYEHRISIGHEWLYFNDHRNLKSTNFNWQKRLTFLTRNIRAWEYELVDAEKKRCIFFNLSTFYWGVPIFDPPPLNQFINSTFFNYRLGIGSINEYYKFSINYRVGLSVRFGAEEFSYGYYINQFEIASDYYNGFLIGPFISIKPSINLTKKISAFTEIGTNYYLRIIDKKQTRLVGFGQLGLTYSFHFDNKKEKN